MTIIPNRDSLGAPTEDHGSIDVAFVSMPYVELVRPSLALGLFKKILEQRGITSRTFYPNLWFAEKVGARRHHLVCQRTFNEFLCGEWTFAAAAFPDADRGQDEEYLRHVGEAHHMVPGFGRDGDDERLRGDLRHLREAATEFVDEVASRVLATGARVVGCTSSFEQHTASLALLRRVKELDPEAVTMIGGANCETEMGLTTHLRFPWVDFVVSGEADNLIGDLCRTVLDRGLDVPPEDLPDGVFCPAQRKASGFAVLDQAEKPPRILVENLDDLPTPDYDDYFAELESSLLAEGIRPGLPFETSRGCWWGAARHCTFCGLNGGGMAYRSKSAERVLREMDELEESYGISDFETVDNILDMGYFKSVLPELAAAGGRRRLFYETKANLKRRQVEMMKAAGIVWFQPGIESFHSGVLDLMDKGVHGWQNIQLLRWSREYGLRVFFSILWGFPGEDDGWYTEMASWMPRLEHLAPPAGIYRLRYDRFSVYHDEPERFGLELEPVPAMSYIYPLPVEDLRHLSYYFVDPKREDPFFGAWIDQIAQQRPGLGDVFRGAETWRRASQQEEPPVLTVNEDEDELRFHDTRSCARQHRTVISGLARELYLLCEEAPNRERIASILKRRGVEATHGDVEAAIDDLETRGLVLSIDHRLIALAVRGDLPEIPKPSQFPGGHVDLALLNHLYRSTATDGPREHEIPPEQRTNVENTLDTPEVPV